MVPSSQSEWVDQTPGQQVAKRDYTFVEEVIPLNLITSWKLSGAVVEAM